MQTLQCSAKIGVVPRPHTSSFLVSSPIISSKYDSSTLLADNVVETLVVEAQNPEYTFAQFFGRH